MRIERREGDADIRYFHGVDPATVTTLRQRPCRIELKLLLTDFVRIPEETSEPRTDRRAICALSTIVGIFLRMCLYIWNIEIQDASLAVKISRGQL